MNLKLCCFGAIALGLGLLGACHDDRHGAPAAAGSQSLDTAQVLSLAQKTSETDAPLAVNGGAVTLTDSSDTSTPIAVSAM